MKWVIDSTMNPLFQNTSQLLEQNKISRLELTGFNLENNQALYVEIIEGHHKKRKLQITPLKTKKSIRYRIDFSIGEVSTFRFLVETNGVEDLTGEIQNILPGEDIKYNWAPIEIKKQVKILKNKKNICLTDSTVEQIKLFLD